MMMYYPCLLLALSVAGNFTAPAFEAQVVDNNISIGYGIAVGDVDGDQKPDILLADKKKFVWYRNGDWQRFVMAEHLTPHDNVCIAARDIDGDGQVEVAVGAQWNPAETSDTLSSGAVYFLVRPEDPAERWKPIKLHHEPTVHRMRWVKADAFTYHLIVLPLHGRGNRDGEGEPVKIIAYEKPANPAKKWRHRVIDQSMHLTHNFDVLRGGAGEWLYIGGREGIKTFAFNGSQWQPVPSPEHIRGKGFGEVRIAKNAGKGTFVAAIEPMHGNELTVYTHGRKVVTADLGQGHALAAADVLNKGSDQIIAGWREPNSEGKTGIKLFVPTNTTGTMWSDFWIDDNGIACEDLQVADLNGDGKKDIIAAGRATHNLKIYWNKSF